MGEAAGQTRAERRLALIAAACAASTDVLKPGHPGWQLLYSAFPSCGPDRPSSTPSWHSENPEVLEEEPRTLSLP